MNDRHDEYRELARGVALGALGPADRRDFESHLAECSICTGEVHALLPLHGLLA